MGQAKSISDYRETIEYYLTHKEFFKKKYPVVYLSETGEPIIDSIDMESFRRTAAKDFLAGMIANPNLGYYGNQEQMVKSAIEFADALIKKLNES